MVHRFWQLVVGNIFATKPKCSNCGLKCTAKQARQLEGKPCYE